MAARLHAFVQHADDLDEAGLGRTIEDDMRRIADRRSRLRAGSFSLGVTRGLDPRVHGSPGDPRATTGDGDDESG